MKMKHMYTVQASEGKSSTELVGGATGAWNSSIIPYTLNLVYIFNTGSQV